MAIKINTAYKEILTSTMLNEKISGIVGGNEKANGFDVSINTSTSVTITPGRAYVDGCSIEETSDTRTITLDENTLSNNGIVYIVLEYIHKTKAVTFSCGTQVNSNMVKLATLVIKNGAVTELVNHESINTLNTVVGASADIEAQKIRDAIPSGFTELGQLDYDFMLNNENKVKIKGKSTAYVNGYRVEIPADTIIDIGKAPEKTSREDLLFLETWKDSDFAKSGQLKWRIRHVDGVDFNAHGADGLERIAAQHLNGHIHAQGGLVKPPFTEQQCAWITEFTKQSNDAGLYKTSNHSVFTPATTGYLNTVDNQSYAIPMFRLYRKPSCGKSVPFEYSKINPKVDYSKFVKLMKEERAERVVTENIKGRSLVNLVKCSSKDIQLDDLGSFWGKYLDYVGGGLKPNTTYTLIIDFKLQNSVHIKLDSIMLGTSASLSQWGNNFRVFDIPIGANCIKFTTPSDYDKAVFAFVIEKISSSTQPTLQMNKCMIIEGDLSKEKLTLEQFDGLKSLGEDDGNLIIVKNGILSDDTYDVNDGKQILTTFSDVTHITSTNAITPKIKAVIKKDDDSSPVEKLGTKLITKGTETVEFTKITGKTLQNLTSCEGGVLNYNPVPSNSLYVSPAYKLKAGTNYTIIIDIIENTLDSAFKLSLHGGGQTLWKHINVYGKTGEFRFLFNESIEVGSIRFYTDNTHSGKAKIDNIRLLEGDHRNTPSEELPCMSGIQSVGECEVAERGKYQINIKSHGKNLFDGQLQRGYWYDNILKPSDYAVSNVNNIPIKTNTVYSFYIEGYTENIYVEELNSQLNGIKSFAIKSGQSIVTTCGKFLRFCTFNGESGKLEINAKVQIEEGASSTPYTTHKKYNQDIYLKQPLRSLSDKIYDEIVGNKVIRRVGTITLNGSENWSGNSPHTTLKWHMLDGYISVKGENGSIRPILCDKLRAMQINLYTAEVEGICLEQNVNGVSRVQINSTETNIRAWLAANPVTLYYELANPVEEYLENTYEKESVKTYQLDAPLRNVPGGVADEIKDGVLIRRCGEIRLDGTILPNKYSVHANGNTHTRFRVPIPGMASSGTSSAIRNNCVGLCDKLSQLGATPNGGSTPSAVEGIYNGAAYYDSTPVCYISVANSKIANGGITEWLRANPIKIIYELDTHIEIPLIEAAPQTADFSMYRQFTQGNWLRELPDGVRDTVENGKVIRRVGELSLSGGESYESHDNTDNYNEYKTRNSSIMTITPESISDGFPQTNNHRIVCSNNVVYIRFPKSMNVTTPELCKQWFVKYPTKVLYKLESPTEEPLSDSNYMLYPHHDINTYCGSMYVGDGRNDILNINGIPSVNRVVLETDFRQIEGKARVEDCKYKKCDDGYNTMFKVSKSRNLFDVNYVKKALANVPGVMMLDEGIKLDLGVNSSVANDVHNILGSFMQKQFKPQTSYIFKIHEYSTDNNSQFSATWQVNYSDGSYAAIKGNVVITPPQKDVVSVRLGWNTQTRGGWTMLNKFQIEENLNGQASAYVPFEPSSRAFENTEENDIEDLRHQVSLTGFNYDRILNESFDKLLRGEL